MISDIYKNPLSVTSQFSFCGLPFRMDTYSGCAFNCTYCFARLRGGNISSKKLRAANPSHIISRFQNIIDGKNLNNSIISEYIRHRMPVHFGGMSDPFQPIEKVKKISLKVLEYLCQKKYPIIISTKSSLLSTDPYLNVLKSNPNIIIQYSFSTISDKTALVTEPFSTKPSELFFSIEKLSKSGIKTSIRWQPFIPNISESPEVFVKAISSLGVKHLGFEHLKLPLEKQSPLLARAALLWNYDILNYFISNESINEGRELILPVQVKLANAKAVQNELKKYDITFGAADNEIQYLSDTYCCCSGADQFEGFENWNKFQIAYAIKKSNSREITFDLIKNEWRPQGSLDMHLNSKSRITKKMAFNTIFDYVIDRWQNLNSPFNPLKYHGVVYTGKNDADGFKIYDWTK